MLKIMNCVKSWWAVLLVVVWWGGVTAQSASATDEHIWTDRERTVLRSLWLGSLPPLPVDPSNRYSDNPQAAAFGKKLFSDTSFSGNKKVSCATCHRPDYYFTDNLPLSHGMDTTPRRSMPLAGTAYNTWFFWDGRKDSLWAQALGPIESQLEHGITRTMSAYIISQKYRDEYTAIFGPIADITQENWPQSARPASDDPVALKAWVLMDPEKRREVNRIYVNMGKAIAAFVRTIVPEPAPFDEYVEAVLTNREPLSQKLLTNEEVAGLRLFIGKAKCTNCHNGPLFTNGEFHALGLPDRPEAPNDQGRLDAITKVLADEFNCLSQYSDADPRECGALRFIDTADTRYKGAFKTPSLRNVAERPPYMHAGQFATLEEVLRFYRDTADSPELGHSTLTDRELKDLAAFLKTLSSPLTVTDP
jgi:cytochrome c peroxidase